MENNIKITFWLNKTRSCVQVYGKLYITWDNPCERRNREKRKYLHLNSTVKWGGSIWAGTVAQYSPE
jgi:hypothetical protein